MLMREELEQERGRGAEVEEALTALAVELDGLRGAARGQATRIRLRALRDAAELADRVAEVSRPAGGDAGAVDRRAARVDQADRACRW